MNNFDTIKKNVGTRVGDTSSGFSTTIGGYINQRYQRIFKKFNWDIITPAYTFNTVANTNEYTMPSDFAKPLYVFDNTNQMDLREKSIQDFESMFTSNLNDNGNPLYYALYRTIVSNAIVTKMRLIANPTSVIQLIVPYINKAVDMSAITDTPILDMADLASELGATADAWRTKRQFAKAADFETQYEQVIGEMIWDQENKPNKVVQFYPRKYDNDQLY